MWEAAERFDNDLGNKFITFAKHWIKQKIRRSIINTGFATRKPEEVFWQISKSKRIKNSINRDGLSCDEIDNLIMKKMNISKKK